MANTTPTIKGKDNLYKHFQATKGCYWKVYNAYDTKAPLLTYTGSKSLDHSLTALKEFVDVVDPEGIFILDTFIPTDGKDKEFVRPHTSVCFTVKENDGRQPSKPNEVITGTSTYSPEFGAHIKLITDNARLLAENEFSATKLQEALSEVNRLRLENDVLNNTIDEYENEEEEDGEEVSGTGINMNAKEKLMSSLAGLLDRKGDLLIEKFAGNSFNKATVQTPINGTDEETKNVMQIFNGLKQHDEKIFEHLVKLLVIAEQQPDTFKFLINNLEDMK